MFEEIITENYKGMEERIELPELDDNLIAIIKSLHKVDAKDWDREEVRIVGRNINAHVTKKDGFSYVLGYGTIIFGTEELTPFIKVEKDNESIYYTIGRHKELLDLLSVTNNKISEDYRQQMEVIELAAADAFRAS